VLLRVVYRIAAMASITGVIAANAAEIPPPPPPLPHAIHQRLADRPEMLAQWVARLRESPSSAARPATKPVPATTNSPWRTLTNHPTFTPGAMLLLRDGTVMVQDNGSSNNGTRNWWRLTPDSSGSYVNGAWSRLASLPIGYSPLFFASAVLPDGNVIIEGGEYNKGKLVDTRLGALYRAATNSWTAVPPPKGSQWTQIGDAPSIVLANGTFMLETINNPGKAANLLFNESLLTWTPTGKGKADTGGEEGLTLLPDDTVLAVDFKTAGTGNNSEIYNQTTGAWTSAGSTIVPLFNATAYEIGPQLLRPDGTVFVAGATGHTAIFDSRTHVWRAGPDFPTVGGNSFDVADGPAATLPNGNILIIASPGTYSRPSHFYIFDGTALIRAADTSNAASTSSFQCHMLVLPTGQVLFNDSIYDVEIYSDPGPATPAWAPTITSVPRQLKIGGTFALTGRQLNGVTQGAAYGDDYQPTTNYPLVRIVNGTTGHVFYAPTSGSTSASIAPKLLSSTNFTLPNAIETGVAKLAVVANGIASKPVAVTINP